MNKEKTFNCPKCGKEQYGFRTYAKEYFYWDRGLCGEILDSGFLDSEQIYHECNDCGEIITKFINKNILKTI